MDRSTRDAVERRLLRRQMSLSEQALARLPAATRAEAIRQILPTVPESERPAYLDRLRTLKLLPPDFNSAAPAPAPTLPSP
jgi:hypothetical protein